jgi:hypothetical protein
MPKTNNHSNDSPSFGELNGYIAPDPANDTIAKLKSSYSLAELMGSGMPDIEYLCFPFIPEGLLMLAGPPKIGKTTLMRQLTLAAASGGNFLGRRCERSRVIFLSLEESAPLMKTKLSGLDLSDLDDESNDITFIFELARGPEGVSHLREILENIPAGTRQLLLIDSLSSFRSPQKGPVNQFAQDYEALTILSSLAKHIPGLSIVVLHHTTKVKNSDPIANISGTHGVSAAIDNFMVLMEDKGFILACGGRMWAEEESRFHLIRRDGGWHLDESEHASFSALTGNQKIILDILGASSEPMTRADISKVSGIKPNHVGNVLNTLRTRGLAVPQKRGAWTLVPPSPVAPQ